MRSTIFLVLAVFLSALSVSAQRRDIVTGSITASGQTVVAEVFDRPTCTVILSGTFSLTPVFEASLDSSTWIPVSMVRTSDGTQTQAPGAIATATAWEQNLSGFKWFRLRCTAYTSGTGTVKISTTDVPVTPTPGTIVVSTPACGALVKKVISAATTNATVVKASPGVLLSLYVTNTNAADRFLKLYNKATAPTVGTDVPVMTINLHENSAESWTIPAGINFSAGISYAITTGVADADVAAVGANDVVATLVYN